MRKMIPILLGGAGLALAVYSFLSPPASKLARGEILAAWTVGPPVYFWLEYFVMANSIAKEEMERYKMFQELSRNVWAGIAAALAIGYFTAR